MTFLDRLRRWFQRPRDRVLSSPDEVEQAELTTPAQKGALLDEGKVPPPPAR
jgi:hypothetical protein